MNGAEGLFLLLLAAPVAAAFSSSSRGLTTANFLQVGAGGRAEALGEAYTALAEGSDAVYWNPAGMTRTASKSAMFMHSAYVDSSFFDYAGYAQNLGRQGAWGAAVQYFSAGSIAGMDASGKDTGDFTPNDLAVSAGYAYAFADGASWIQGTSLGMTVKYIRTHIVSNAQTAAVDAGLMTPAYFDGRLRLGAVVQNLGGAMKFDSASENLPLAFKFGAAYRVTGRWLTTADFGLPRGNAPYCAVGTEYRMPFNDGFALSGRIGVNTRVASESSVLGGASMGVGFGFKRFDADYALVMLGDLGLTHRLSLTVRY